MRTIPIDSIEVRDRWREAGDVSELAASINRLGLLNPITVKHASIHPRIINLNDIYLIAGLRRLEACKSLGWTEIECNFVDLYNHDIEIAEIDENLIRQELTALQRSEQLQRREGLYRLKGGNKISTLGGEQEVGFAKDASEAIGLTKQSINQYLAVARGIPEKLRDELRGTDAEDNFSELRALASADSRRQKHAVKAYKAGEAESIREALDAKPKPLRIRPINTARVVRVTVNDLWASAPLLELIMKGGIDGISPKEAGELLELMEGPLRTINRLKSQLKELRDGVQGDAS